MTISNWSDDRDNADIIERQNKEIKKLKDELSKYKKGFNILNEYFDSISDEEQKVMLLENNPGGVKKWSRVELQAIIENYKQ